jgi:polar amino acid transport system substrate-binding protein
MTTRRSFNAALLASLGTAGWLAGATAARADTLGAILKSGVVRIAVPQDFPPFGSVGVDMQPQGYDIDMAKLVAAKLGVRLVMVPVSSENRLPYLQTGKVDLIISSLGKSPAREKVIDFSAPYAPFFSGVFGPPKLQVTSPADLAGKSIGVTRGAIEDLVLSKIAPPGTLITRYGDNESTIAAFLSGQTQLIATASSVAAVIAARHPPRLPELKFKLKDSPCYIGLNKGQPALLTKVNAIIAGAEKDGSLNAISLKWLGAPLPATF